ncbi:MAG TPA: DUF4337 family protein [Verrucomicrobiae bacterium]|nr:DUF4337 family protein [Verrucomicrobiae bacterium]
MSEAVHSKLSEANEIHESAGRGHRIAPVAAAIIAVLAALGTLFSHHRSIMVLTAKNGAILKQAQASDRFNSYESKRIRYQLIQALLDAGLPQDPGTRARFVKAAENLDAASLETQNEARELERRSMELENQAEELLQSYETLEIGTTFCEVAIVIVSLSALARRQWIFLTVGAALSGTGLVFLVVGFFQAH